jgi:hypothetical protein
VGRIKRHHRTVASSVCFDWRSIGFQIMRSITLPVLLFEILKRLRIQYVERVLILFIVSFQHLACFSGGYRKFLFTNHQVLQKF